MLPYLRNPLFEVSGRPVYAFGLLALVGIVVGEILAERAARARGLDPIEMRWLGLKVTVVGLVSAHVLDVVAYRWSGVRADPFLVVRLWDGMSSYGGVVGGVCMLIVLARRDRLPLLCIGDAMAHGFPVALFFGRLGCYTAHDHPGRRTSFWLSVAYPGGARHDLGLDEALVLVPIAIAVHVVGRRTARPGAVLATLAIAYAPARFALDFLRATDVRHPDVRWAGLTPAQWVSIALFAIGIALWRRASRAPQVPGYAPAHDDA